LPADTPLHGVFAVDEGSASIAVAAAAVFSFTLRAFALQSATAADFTMKGVKGMKVFSHRIRSIRCIPCQPEGRRPGDSAALPSPF
jgi:hypothetical protein